MIRFFAAAGLIVAAVAAQPAAAQVKLGNNNTGTQDGKLNGAQTGIAVGVGAVAQNGIASIMTATGGVSIGDNNKITQTGKVNGAQTATAVGVGAVAQNGVASIMAGR